MALMLLTAGPVAAAKVAKLALPNDYSWLQGFPTTIHDFHWSTANGGRWVDDRCGTSRQRFRIVMYKHKDFRGSSVVLCHNFTNNDEHGKPGATFCEVPLGMAADVYDTASCNLTALLNTGTANDKISSIDVIRLGSARCLRLFEHRDHRGRSLMIDGDIRNLHQYRVRGVSMGDRVSSISPSSAYTCAGAFG